MFLGKPPLCDADLVKFHVLTLNVMHYLCVKCGSCWWKWYGELKGQWCGDPAVISVEAWSKERERGKETECGHILVRVDIALEIQSYNPYYLSGNPQEVGYRHRKGYHCRSDKICPDQLVLTLVLLEQSVSDLIIHNNTCLLGWATIEHLLESNRCSGGRDVRRWFVTWLLLTSMEGSHVIQMQTNAK